MNRRTQKILLWSAVTALVLAAACAIAPFLWYHAPPICRVLYYKKYSPAVFDSIIEDDNFEPAAGKTPYTYDFHTPYAIPFAVKWQITDTAGTNIKLGRPPEYILYEMEVEVQLLIGDRVISSYVTTKPLPIAYSHHLRTGEESWYFPLLRCDFPLECRSNENCSLRITFLKIDPRLQGAKGKLIVKPDTTL